MNLKSEKDKKRILLICDEHSHIIKNYIELLSNNFAIYLYCSYKYKNQVSNSIKKKIKFFYFPQGLIYFFLILKSFKYDYIFIITGPQEFNRIKGLIGIFGYLIFVFFYGKKTIMGIRDNNKYFRNNERNFIEKILNFSRNVSLTKIYCLFFETKTLMNNFKKKNNNKKINCLPIYPLHIVNKKIKIHKLNSNILRIGLLGSVDEKNIRRNYNMLVNVINLLDTSLQKKIELVLLGWVQNGENNTIIQNLKKKIKSEIIYQKNYIKDTEFKKLSLSCHILLSINKKKYGNSHKGTGAFFDAIFAKKPFITNLISDRQFEFKNFCYYYSNSSELLEILKIFLKKNNKLKPFNKNTFTKYNNRQAKYELTKLIC
jgi:hypothetical protein